MISNCLFFHNEEGVLLEDSAQALISSCQLFGHRDDAISIYGAARAVICRNIIKSNRGFGILSYSSEETTGEENVMEGNGVDLGGNVSGSLRIPLREPTEREIIFPDPRYHHLQEAVDALISGGTLRIKPGTYRTNVTVGKKIRVVGEKGACLLHYSQKPWLPEYSLPVLSLVRGAEVEINNLELQASCLLAVVMAGADARLVMENCSIIGHIGDEKNVEHGIILMQSTSATFSMCVISQTMAGFMLRDAAHAEISNCEISHGVCGVYLEDLAGAHISNNCFRDNRCGIHSISLGEVEGNGNRMIENGIDLVGNLPGTLRTALRTDTEIEIRFPDDRYSSLQEAVDALIPGGRLILEVGQYLAGVTLDKPLTLEAVKENGATLTARTNGAPVLSLVGGADVVLNGLLITSGKERPLSGEGIVLGRNARAILKKCTILNNYKGILVQGHAEAVLTDCVIRKNDSGVVVEHRARVSIIDSSVSENQFVGITLEDVTQAAILNCSIALNKGDGLRLQDNANLEIEKTQIFLNDGYGLVANIEGCRGFSKADEFMGCVRGTENLIPGPTDPTGNKRGGLCPPYPGAPWPANFLRNRE
jgi:parallel beta-helix repeat protein